MKVTFIGCTFYKYVVEDEGEVYVRIDVPASEKLKMAEIMMLDIVALRLLVQWQGSKAQLIGVLELDTFNRQRLRLGGAFRTVWHSHKRSVNISALDLLADECSGIDAAHQKSFTLAVYTEDTYIQERHKAMKEKQRKERGEPEEKPVVVEVENIEV